MKPNGSIGLDNPALMWPNEALRYTAHGLMLHIRLPEHNRSTVPSLKKKKKEKNTKPTLSEHAKKLITYDDGGTKGTGYTNDPCRKSSRGN